MRSTQIAAAERTAMVARLHAAGVGPTEIAERVGICQRAVFARLARIKDGPKPKRPGTRPPRGFWDSERLSELRHLWDEGVSASVIGSKLGATRNAVLGKVHRLRLASRAETERMPIDRSVKDKKDRVRFSPEQQRERDRLAKELRRRAKGVLPRGERPKPAEVTTLPSLAIPFTSTTRDHCRWICSEAGAPVTVCGHQTVNDGSWCAHHAGVVFTPPRGRMHHAVLDKGRPSQSTRWAGYA